MIGSRRSKRLSKIKKPDYLSIVEQDYEEKIENQEEKEEDEEGDSPVIKRRKNKRLIIGKEEEAKDDPDVKNEQKENDNGNNGITITRKSTRLRQIKRINYSLNQKENNFNQLQEK